MIGTKFSIFVNGVYLFFSFPSPNSTHSANQYGLDGSLFSNRPITLYLAVFNCLYDLRSCHHTTQRMKKTRNGRER